MFSLKCKLCAFINTTKTYVDYVRAYRCAVLACTKEQCTRRVHKHIFTYTKKRARKFSFFPGLSTHLLGKGSSLNVTSNIERL